VIREWTRHWDPSLLFFQNHLTGIIWPIRSTFRGKAYGSNVKYLAILKMLDGDEKGAMIWPDLPPWRRSPEALTAPTKPDPSEGCLRTTLAGALVGRGRHRRRAAGNGRGARGPQTTIRGAPGAGTGRSSLCEHLCEQTRAGCLNGVRRTRRTRAGPEYESLGSARISW
jgi:hypothetical protein